MINRGEKTRYVFSTEDPPVNVSEGPDAFLHWKLWQKVLATRLEWKGFDVSEFTTRYVAVRPSGGPDVLELQPPVGEPNNFDGFYLNINAADCSIELDWIVAIQVPPGASLLDGEVHDDVILNRPIGLFPVERFRDNSRWLETEEFIPEMIFHFGELEDARNACATICTAFVQRLVAVRRAEPEHLETWQRLGRRRFNLCPVTRSLIRRHQATNLVT